MKLLIFLSVVIAVILIVNAKPAKHDKKIDSAAKNCSISGYGDCVLKGKATCGRGKKEIKFVDPTCHQTPKKERCFVPCGDETALPGKKQGKQANARAPEHKNGKHSHANCGYENMKKAKRTGNCDPATKMQTITLELTHGDRTTCAPTKVVEKRCKSRNARSPGRKNRKGAGTTEIAVPGLEKEAGAGKCRYRKSTKGECSAAGTRSIVKTLKKGSPATCDPTKTEVKPCKQKPNKGEKTAKKTKNQKKGNNN